LLVNSLEELSQVKCLFNWRNRRVRVVGRITALDISTCTAFISSEGEEIQSSIKVNFTTFFQGEPNSQTRLIKVGSLIQILGEVDVLNDVPLIHAHIVKDMLGLDTAAYHRAVDRIQPYLPINIQLKP
jgi:hypothetical protein